MSNNDGYDDEDFEPRQKRETAMTTRDALGGEMVQSDGSSSALAEQAVAEIQAQYALARRFPREIEDVRTAVLKECARSSFAAVAIYRKPIGKGVEGLSVRFVETVLGEMGNVGTLRAIVSDTPTARIIRVTVNDMEKNSPRSEDVYVDKTVERKQLKDGQLPLGKRKNSQGDWVYLVAATPDEILNTESALASKALRRCGLKIIPGWLQAEAKDLIYATRVAKVKQDPDAERRSIMDAFAKYNIKPSDLDVFLGHSIDIATPDELINLRGAYVMLREGQVSWADIFAGKLAEQAAAKGETVDGQKPDQRAAAAAAALREKTEKMREKAKPTAASNQAPAAASPAKPPSKPALTDAEIAARIDAGQDDPDEYKR